MNSLTNRDYEIYNNMNYTSEYNPGLINPQINNFFNDVLNKPEPVYKSYIKNEYTWKKFYKDYVEHNLLFIVILVGVIIFLIIRYHTKDMDPDKICDREFTDDTDSDDDDLDFDDKKMKKKLKKKYKTKLKKYKKELYDEKNKILNIIDELSNINYEDQSYNQYLKDNYEKQISQLESQRKQDMIEQQRQLNELRQYNDLIQGKKTDMMNLNIKPSKDKSPLDHTIKNWEDSDDDKSSFYNLKKYKKQNNNDVINGLYIEAPYN